MPLKLGNGEKKVFFPLWVQRSELETSTGIQNGEGTELGSHGWALGCYNRETQRENHNGENDAKWEMSLLYFNIFLKIDFYQQIMSTISFKTFSGSFSGYWNKNLVFFLQNIFCQKMFKNEISTHKLCPKSGLKHSVVHSQGIGIKN